MREAPRWDLFGLFASGSILTWSLSIAGWPLLGLAAQSITVLIVLWGLTGHEMKEDANNG